MDLKEIAEIAYKLIRAIAALISAVALYKATIQKKKPTTRKARHRHK